MKHQMVCVIWHDAHSIGETWMSLSFDVTPCVVESVGWLLDEAKAGHVVLAQSHNDNEDYDHILAIPHGMVKELRQLTQLPDISTPELIIKAD